MIRFFPLAKDKFARRKSTSLRKSRDLFYVVIVQAFQKRVTRQNRKFHKASRHPTIYVQFLCHHTCILFRQEPTVTGRTSFHKCRQNGRRSGSLFLGRQVAQNLPILKICDGGPSGFKSGGPLTPPQANSRTGADCLMGCRHRLSQEFQCSQSRTRVWQLTCRWC